MAKKIDLTLATPQQCTEIRQEINHLERMLESDKRSRSPKIQDVEEFKAEISKKKKMLEAHAPKALRGKNKDKAFKRAKELGKFIEEQMPKSKDYFKQGPKRGCDNDFDRTVRQQIIFQTDPKIQKAIHEYKNLMGRLEPNDPTIRNIERLRR